MFPQQIIDALRHVRYPGNGKDLIDSGMLEDDIRIAGLAVSFSLIFEKQNDPFMRSVLKAAETAIKTYVDPNAAVSIHSKFVKQTAAPTETEPTSPNHIKHIIAVSSGKGGVGKSTIASNLAVALAQQGFRVGLLDADIFGPSQPHMFHCEGYRPIAETVNGRDLIQPIEQYGVKMLSIGFFVDTDSAIVWRGGLASNAVKQLLNDAYWGELDYMLIDLPPGTSDIHLTVVQVAPLAGAIVVTTPQPVALIDARKGIDMFRNEKINVPILGIVENMAWFIPRELPNNRYYIFGKEGGKALAEKLKVPLLAEIPLVQSIREGADDGLPIVLQKDHPAAQLFLNLGTKIASTLPA